MKDLFQAFPDGLTYQESFLSSAEEQSLLSVIGGLPLQEAEYKQFTAKRRIASFGATYDFNRNKLQPGPPIPASLFPLREKVAGWLKVPAGELRHVLITEYRAGSALGWHRDTPEFGIVAGISLASATRMRFRPYPPAKGRDPRAFALMLEPCSIYTVQRDARWKWQHSVPATKALRYSITLRTMLRTPG